MRLTGRRGAESRSTRLSAVCLVLVVGLLPRTSYGQEKTPLFIDEVRFKGTPSSMEKQVPLWGSALAAELSGVLRDAGGVTPMTLQNLESQLGKEERKASLACEEASCINRIVENFGISESVFGVVTWLGPMRVQVTLVHTAGDEKLGEAAPRYATPDYDAITQALRTMTGELFGVRGSGRVIEERDIGEKGETWSMDVQTGVLVSFESDPTGAVVLVDGQLQCPGTPCSKTLAGGSHKVEMQKESYVPETTSISVGQGMKPVRMTLTPDFGWLTVKSDPAGLPVLVDGQHVGVTPLVKQEVSRGPHEVLVSDPRYYDRGKQIQIDRGESEKIRVELVAREGGLVVKARDEKGNDIEAEVWLDGNQVGVTPLAHQLIIGTHSLSVVYRGQKWELEDVEVKEKEVEQLVVTLKETVRDSSTPPGAEVLKGMALVLYYQNQSEVEARAMYNRLLQLGMVDSLLEPGLGAGGARSINYRPGEEKIARWIRDNVSGFKGFNILLDRSASGIFINTW